MISRDTVTFHCQLSAGLKFGSMELMPAKPAAEVFKAGLIVSRLLQVGQSDKSTAESFQPESTIVFHGGLLARRSRPEITFALLM